MSVTEMFSYIQGFLSVDQDIREVNNCTDTYTRFFAKQNNFTKNKLGFKKQCEVRLECHGLSQNL